MQDVDEREAEAPVGLRERKKRARREALIDAAHLLVERDGLDAVTVEAICAHAGVSPRTFFNYFESKDDAVLGIVPFDLRTATAEAFAAGGPTGRWRPDLEALVVSLAQSAPAGLHRIACAMELARREPRLLGRQIAAFEGHHATIAELVARRTGLDPKDAHVETITFLVMSLTRAAFVRWETSGQQGDVADGVPVVMRELHDLLHDG
ncbi:TetR/AcrR family transcriptional regulator [Actinotalea subterranea]|uniref:TetR/AcrR family transcriptional regulator n=1 Tax=Actinotalea subterranea TaxID=2607497 RepID=UPI0011EDBC7B|nr:TetR/AcrR family transcriptional regulator [Actinotalea subterranea]